MDLWKCEEGSPVRNGFKTTTGENPPIRRCSRDGTPSPYHPKFWVTASTASFNTSLPPKVRQLEHVPAANTRPVKQHVLRLDIPVQDVLAVQSPHGMYHLLEEMRGQGLGQTAVPGEDAGTMGKFLFWQCACV